MSSLPCLRTPRGSTGGQTPRGSGDCLTPRDVRAIHAAAVGGLAGRTPRSGAVADAIPPRTPRGGGSATEADARVRLRLAPIPSRDSGLDFLVRWAAPAEFATAGIADPRPAHSLAEKLWTMWKRSTLPPIPTVGGNAPTAGGKASVPRNILRSIEDAERRAEAARRAQRIHSEALLRCAQGAMAFNAGLTDAAVKAFCTAEERFSMIDDTQGLAYAYNSLGICFAYAGQHKMALIFFKKQHNLCSTFGKAMAEINLGVCYGAIGEHDMALNAFSDAVHNSKSAGSAVLEAISVGNLGLASYRTGDMRAAQGALEVCLEHCSLGGDRVGACVCMLMLGDVYAAACNNEHAVFHYEHAVRLAEEVKMVDVWSAARVQLGVVKGQAAAHGALRKAAEEMGAPLTLRDRLPPP